MSDDALSAGALPAPGLARRVASLLYEGVVLFGVVFVSGYLYSSLTQQRNALQGQHGLQAFLFVVLGVYFIWFWSHGGQTVAMKAWHLRVVDLQGRPLSQARALGRYVLGWLWFAPGMLSIATMKAAGVELSTAGILGPLFGGMVAYALLALVLPGRQFVHDQLCRTHIVTHRPPPRLKKARA